MSNGAGDPTESRAPEPSPEASPRASGVPPTNGEPPDFRDRLGRFQVDNPGGPGNPFGRQVARNRQLLFAYFTEEKVLALFNKLETMAAEGNVAASNTLMKYLVGKPAPVVNPDRVNHEEWEMRREQPSLEEVAVQTQRQIPHQAAILMQRAVDMSKVDGLHNEFRSGIVKREEEEAKQKARLERRARRKEERRRRRAGG
jgi:hypothetical protein